MSRATTIAAGSVIALVLLAVLLFLELAGQWAAAPPVEPVMAISPEEMQAPPVVGEGDPRGFLYGRITTVEGANYEGRLRWGDAEEAFWSDFFNGFKKENPWVADMSSESLPKESYSVELLGFEVAERERPRELGRSFMTRFGDIRRIDARGSDVSVTLKSGTVFRLDRNSAGDFDDGVRVWDDGRGVVDLGPRQIRTIELLPTAEVGAVPARLYGTVRTEEGDFTGFLQWGREKGVASDELIGETSNGRLRVRFDAIRSIARDGRDSSRVTLLDGREIVLSGTRETGDGHLGVYVDDPRYGRVLVSWDAFDRVDFSPGGSSPGYDDFPPGGPLTGSVTTRAGRRLTGRLIFDLDESETTETLDAPFQGVDYTIPFERITSIEPADPEDIDAETAKVTLRSGEELRLEAAGDLREANAGLLIFIDGSEHPKYLPWADVERIDF